MDKIIEFEDWIGEFGWEIATWAPFCRYIAKNYDKAIVTSFAGMEALYSDFAEFRCHNRIERKLDFKKQYRLKEKAIYVKYGKSKHVKDILIHARGLRKNIRKNYLQWEALKYLDAGWIGLNNQELKNYKNYPMFPNNDLCFGLDLRNLPLQELMNIIAGAKIVVGQSSGIMHLAMFCGTPVITWGDNKKYNGKPLRDRYENVWNPFNVKVHWIECDNWQPSTKQIESEVRNVIGI